MNKIFIVAVLAFCAVELNAQTFQYSRGWTNGKRSGGVSATDMPPLRQMMPNPMVQVLTANDLSSRERYDCGHMLSSLRLRRRIINFILCGYRLIQQIIKNPCEIRMALLNHNVKFVDDYLAADGLEEPDAVRFKRELMNH